MVEEQFRAGEVNPARIINHFEDSEQQTAVAALFHTQISLETCLLYTSPVYCAADQDAFVYFTACHSDVSFEAGECTGKYGLLSYNKRDYKKKHAPRPVSYTHLESAVSAPAGIRRSSYRDGGPGRQ